MWIFSQVLSLSFVSKSNACSLVILRRAHSVGPFTSRVRDWMMLKTGGPPYILVGVLGLTSYAKNSLTSYAKNTLMSYAKNNYDIIFQLIWLAADDIIQFEWSTSVLLEPSNLRAGVPGLTSYAKNSVTSYVEINLMSYAKNNYDVIFSANLIGCWWHHTIKSYAKNNFDVIFQPIWLAADYVIPLTESIKGGDFLWNLQSSSDLRRRQIALCGYLTVTTKHRAIFQVQRERSRLEQELTLKKLSVWIPYGDNEARRWMFFNVSKKLRKSAGHFLCGYLTVTTKHKKVKFVALQSLPLKKKRFSVWIPYGDNEARRWIFLTFSTHQPHVPGRVHRPTSVHRP